jgi:putative SOS response-associated peptidase YedK
LGPKSEPDAAAALMKPANEDVLNERVVSKAVGNVKNNGPELLA